MNDSDYRPAKMSVRWQTESGYLSRYAGSGVLNTLIGLSVIFVLMGLGASPFVANIGGYAIGFILGFAVSKKFVFRSNGRLVDESLRYLIAFCLCFVLNLLALGAILSSTGVGEKMAQIMAASVYTGSMYLLTRLYVFPDLTAKKEDRPTPSGKL